MLYGEPPAWAAEAIAMLRMVEANKEVPGLGFRYNEDIFYIDGELEKNDPTQRRTITGRATQDTGHYGKSHAHAYGGEQ